MGDMLGQGPMNLRLGAQGYDSGHGRGVFAVFDVKIRSVFSVIRKRWKSHQRIFGSAGQHHLVAFHLK
jgi:hypothetical protein